MTRPLCIARSIERARIETIQALGGAKLVGASPAQLSGRGLKPNLPNLPNVKITHRPLN